MVRQPTQEDVAQLAGVSRSTVSIVLNKRTDRQIRISEDTRAKVWEAAEQLGYEPNAMARSLRSGQSYNIGVLIPNLSNMHYIEILDGIQRVLSVRGYHLVLVVTDFDPEQERWCFSSLFQQRLDGLVLMPTFWDQMPDEMANLAEMGRPAVFLTPGVDDLHDRVLSDIASGARALMDHLLAQGHTRIGFINGAPRKELTVERQQVYREKLSAAHIRFDEQLFVNCGPEMDDGYHAAAALLALPSPPTAIWTINDFLAIGVRRAIYDQGLRIPEDVALAGCDGTALAEQFSPPLTTIQIPAREIGEHAAQAVLSRIDNPDMAPVFDVLPTKLVIRRSTHAPAS